MTFNLFDDKLNFAYIYIFYKFFGTDKSYTCKGVMGEGPLSSIADFKLIDAILICTESHF
jgi:hypothetical protein